MDLRNALWAISIFCGLSYFATNVWDIPGHTVVKGLSVSTMALIAWLSLPAGRNRLLLTAALAFSSLGDILLDISSKMFVFGLGAFLLAHLCCVPLFLLQRKKGDSLGAPRIVLAVALVAFSDAISIWMLPSLGGMAVPVMAYVTVLTGMAVSSLFWKASTNWIIAGAILFLISDTVLGVNKFVQPIPYRGWIVWSTYYAAQFLITRGSLKEFPQAVENAA